MDLVVLLKNTREILIVGYKAIVKDGYALFFIQVRVGKAIENLTIGRVPRVEDCELALQLVLRERFFQLGEAILRERNRHLTVSQYHVFLVAHFFVLAFPFFLTEAGELAYLGLRHLLFFSGSLAFFPHNDAALVVGNLL